MSRPGDFDRLVGGFLDDYLRRHPTLATSLGDHRFDAELPPMSREAIEDEIQKLKAARAGLQAVDRSSLDQETGL